MSRSYRELLEEKLRDCHADDGPVVFDGENGTWLEVRPRSWPVRLQGWKIHVSASVDCAEATIRRCVPVLVEERVTFKIAASSEIVRRLVTGELGHSQVAKFLTAYPSSDDQAARIAAMLTQVTVGLSGPPPLYDRVLEPGSMVSVRYGDFVGRSMQQDSGLIVPAITDGAGNMTFDDRTSREVPDWVNDPFDIQPTGDPTLQHLVAAGRFVPIARVAASPRGDLVVGLDLVESKPCIIKTARPGAFAVSGAPSAERLGHEAAMLARLWPTANVPRVLAFGTTPGQGAFLVTTDVGGCQLGSRLYTERLVCGCPLAIPIALALASALADGLEILAATQVVHGDLNPSNVLVSADFRTVYLVDFEYSSFAGSDPQDAGTPGFVSPQRRHGKRSSFADDVYGFGALIYMALTGANPPAAHLPADTWPAMTDRAPETFVRLVDRCLSTEPTERPDGRELRGLLSTIDSRQSPVASVRDVSHTELIDWADQVVEGLVRDAVTEGAELRWVSDDPAVFGGTSLDLSAGSAGTVYGLSVMERTCPRDESADMLQRASSTLIGDWQRNRPRLNGYWVGTFGIARALLAAATVLDDGYCEASAFDLIESDANFDSPVLDVYAGTAGQAITLMRAWQFSGHARYLDRATRIADRLVELQAANGLWPAPNADAVAYLGYAHGAAGIADVLLAVHRATGDCAYLAAAALTAEALQEAARPLIGMQDGVAWPSAFGTALSEPFWCHGATGIGSFLLSYFRVSGRCDIAATVVAAANAAASARWLGPAVCPGLAGSTCFVADVDSALPGRLAPGVVARLRLVLRSSCVGGAGLEKHLGGLGGVRATPGFLNGNLGVAVALVELATDQRPVSDLILA